MTEKQSWDLGRFFRTLTYFDILPLIGSIDWLKEQILGEKLEQVQPPAINRQEKILVVGATSELGKQLVQQLRTKNYPLKLLVEDVEAAKKLWGEKFPYQQVDLSQPSSWPEETLDGVQTIIYPNLGENLPDAAASQELIKLASEHLSSPSSATIFNFEKPTQEVKQTWGAVDDVVMGGVSKSSLRMFGNVAVFSGNASTANSGGFASVRNRNFEPPLDLSTYEGLQLRVKGDGKRYKLICRCESKWDGIGYSYSFDTLDYHWMTVRIPFSELIPVFRAKTLEDAEPFAADKTHAFQLMYSKFEYNGELNPTFEPGNFELQMESIKAYGGKPKPQLIILDDQDNLASPVVQVVKDSGIPYTLIPTQDKQQKEVVVLTINAISSPEACFQIWEI